MLSILTRYRRHITGNSKIAHGELSKEINSIGEDNFSCEIICTVDTKSDAYVLEEFWTRYYKNLGQCKYNDCFGMKKSDRYKTTVVPWNKGLHGDEYLPENIRKKMWKRYALS